MTVLRSGSATDVGRVRTVNEDLALDRLSLFAVADGMGGHAGGEVASQVAIEVLERHFTVDPTPTGLIDAVREANHAVWERSRSDPQVRGMGTTMTAAALVGGEHGDRLVLANVGDSRAYRFREEELVQLTSDHSVAEELVARGELSEEEAAVHPHRHILTRALGVGPDVEVDAWELEPRQGDRYLLCSDGLTNEVSEDRIATVLERRDDPGDIAATLVRLANEHGGNDNVTVVVVDVVLADPADDLPGGATTGALAGVTVLAGGALGRREPSPLGDGAAEAASGSADDRGGSATTTMTVVPGAATPPGGQPAAPAERPGGDGGQTPDDSVDDAAGAAPGATPDDRPVSGAADGQDAAAVPASVATRSSERSGGSGATTSAGAAVFAAPADTSGPVGPVTGVTRADTSGRVAPGSAPPAAEVSGQAARRRPKGPRLITFRSILFLVVLGAVLYGLYSVVRWYVDNSYFVKLATVTANGTSSEEVVIYQGRQGDFLGIKPKIVRETGVTPAEIPQDFLPSLQSGVEKSSLAAANSYVQGLVCLHLQLTTGNPSPPGCAGISGGSTSTTATTVPKAPASKTPTSAADPRRRAL